MHSSFQSQVSRCNQAHNQPHKIHVLHVLKCQLCFRNDYHINLTMQEPSSHRYLKAYPNVHVDCSSDANRFVHDCQQDVVDSLFRLHSLHAPKQE